MKFINEKTRAICDKLYEMKCSKLRRIEIFLYAETEYKESNTLPDKSSLKPFDNNLYIEGKRQKQKSKKNNWIKI